MPRVQANIRLDQESNRIACLALPQRGKDLLLPAVCVAEIDAVPFFSPESDLYPFWYGYYHWHDVPIPLLGLDVMMYQKPPAEKIRYIAILHTQEEKTTIPFFAIAIQGIPEQYAVEHGDLQMVAGNREAHVLSEVVVSGRQMVIPDISAIEALIQEHDKNEK